MGLVACFQDYNTRAGVCVCVCVYYSGIQNRGGILRISRFALKIAGFIHYIIVLNINFALASSLKYLSFKV